MKKENFNKFLIIIVEILIETVPAEIILPAPFYIIL